MLPSARWMPVDDAGLYAPCGSVFGVGTDGLAVCKAAKIRLAGGVHLLIVRIAEQNGGQILTDDGLIRAEVEGVDALYDLILISPSHSIYIVGVFLQINEGEGSVTAGVPSMR